jgi:valyl-tRNA synthetase
MKPLAEPGMDAVNAGKIKFHPDRWTKVYLNWMRDIRDWCISRQIWWGHRIPVWYCKKCLGFENVRDVEITGPWKDGIYVGDGKNAKCPTCGGTDLEQDPDVLDTWFSSWLWPFSTLGWPGKTAELEKFYPTDTLVTAPEIIFFWVARMIMAGLKFMGDIPFSDVYIHGTVRDATGTKMSKSLGNVIDPLDVIQDVGSDALRFSMISITSQGQDVFLSKSKFDLGRNFSNKLWNASRYVLMNLEDDSGDWDIDPSCLTLPDKWIMHMFNEAAVEVTKSLEVFRFNEATSILYDFIWHKYCDWYLEMTKLAEDKTNSRKILVYLLKGILVLLHPFMPFITEQIWQKIPGNENTWIMEARWPKKNLKYDDNTASEDMAKLIDVITAIRNTRAFWNIKHNSKINVHISLREEKDLALIRENIKYIRKLAGCNIVEMGKTVKRPAESVTALICDIRLFIPLSGEIDVADEKQRIEKKVNDIEKYLVTIEKKLRNKAFIKNAPSDVVKKEETKRASYEEQLKTLKDNLFALK